jgi:hypothetical protein
MRLVGRSPLLCPRRILRDIGEVGASVCLVEAPHDENCAPCVTVLRAVEYTHSVNVAGIFGEVRVSGVGGLAVEVGVRRLFQIPSLLSSSFSYKRSTATRKFGDVGI